MKRLKDLRYAITAALLCTSSAAIADDCCGLTCESAECCTEIILQGDLLNWRARRNSLDYAIPYDDAFFTKGDVKSVCPGWNGGYRVALFAGDTQGVTFGARYTNFRNITNDTTRRPDGQLAATRLSSFHRQTSNGDIMFARGSYKISLDVIDIEVASTRDISDSASMSLFGGFKIAMLDQKLKAFYAEGLEDFDTVDVDLSSQTANMDAAGIYFGGGGEWELCGGLGIFGKASFAALVAGVDRSLKVKGHAPNDPTLTFINLRDHCKTVVTNIDMSIGAQYGFCGMCNSTWHLKVGYDFSQWISTFNFFDLISDNDSEFHSPHHSSDTVGFDGLFVRLEAVF